MKTSLQKLVGITLIVSLSIGLYLFTQDDNTQIDTQVNQSKNVETIQNTSNKTQDSLAKPYIPNKDTYSKLDTNINNLNEVLEQTKKVLKEYNKTQPQNGIISNKEIDRLLTLDTNTDLEKKENLVEFENNKTETKTSTETELTANSNGSHNVTTDSSINSTQTTTESTTSTQNTTSTQVSTSVSSQILELQTEISEVKEIINQLSANQL